MVSLKCSVQKAAWHEQAYSILQKAQKKRKLPALSYEVGFGIFDFG
jgi:hypothetical protein